MFRHKLVATVPTVYGIETTVMGKGAKQLQQYLPFTVLKLCFGRVNPR